MLVPLEANMRNPWAMGQIQPHSSRRRSLHGTPSALDALATSPVVYGSPLSCYIQPPADDAAVTSWRMDWPALQFSLALASSDKDRRTGPPTLAVYV